MKAKLVKYSLTLLTAMSLNADEIYNVDQLILKALENSPDIKISSYNYDASKKRLDISSSSYLPNINLHAEAGGVGMSDIPTAPDDMISDTFL